MQDNNNIIGAVALIGIFWRLPKKLKKIVFALFLEVFAFMIGIVVMPSLYLQLGVAFFGLIGFIAIAIKFYKTERKMKP